MASKINGFTPDEDAFILANVGVFGYTQMGRELEKRYGYPRKHGSVWQRCKNALGVDLTNPSYFRHKKEHIDFIKQNASYNVDISILVDLFNETFKTNLSYNAISHMCDRNNIYPERKGLKMVAGEPNPFSKRCDIGTERISGGKIYIKVADKAFKAGTSRFNDSGNWIEKKRYIYEKFNGSIPFGYQIIFLDGNKANFGPDNLYAITKKINMVMAGKKWFSQNKEQTLTAIKWCELFYSLKGGNT